MQSVTYMGWYCDYIAKNSSRILFLDLKKKKGDASVLDSRSSGGAREWEAGRGREEIRLA